MLTVEDDDRIKATVLLMKAADRDLRKVLNTETRTVMGPEWINGINSRCSGPMDTLVLARGARIKGGNPPVGVAATSTRRRSGGLVPADGWPFFEFGTLNRGKTTRYRTHSRKGKPYTVTRHTRRQLPTRNKSGRVVYATLRDIGPRMVSLWVQTVVKVYRDAADGLG